MILQTIDLCNYLGASRPVACQFKKEVLQHTGKQTKKITLADLCSYENISIQDAKELIKPSKN